jgi:hypothetical protein
MATSLTPNPAQIAASITLPAAVEVFCQANGLITHVNSISDLARDSFDLAEPLTVSMSCDPESGEEWLEVTVTARGSVTNVREAYRELTRRWSALTPLSVQEQLRLVLLAE